MMEKHTVESASGTEKERTLAEKKKKELSPPEKKKKYFSMFLSIIIAVGLWVFVINDENPTIKMIYTDIPIDYLNEDSLEEEGLVVANVQSPVMTRVVLQGKRADLLEVKSSDIAATVDVSQYTKGDNYADVEIHVPSSVTVAGIKPAQIKITIESLISSDKEVSVVFNGTSPANKEAVFLGVEPEQISVTGASSAVKSVKNLQAVVNMSDVSEEKKTLSVSLKPVDELGNEVPGLTLSAETVEVQVQLYSTKTVPLSVQTTGTADPELSVSIEAPESVLITCPEDKLDSVTGISAMPVDITGVTELQEISLTPILPDDVRLTANQEKIAAVIKVQKRSSKTIKYGMDDIQLTGLPEGMSVEMSDEAVSLVVYGDDDLPEVTASDFTLELDCSQLTEEESQATLIVTVSEDAKKLDVTPKAPSVKAWLVQG